MIFCGFAAGSFLKWFYYKVIRRRKFIVEAEPAFGGMAVDETDFDKLGRTKIFDQDDNTYETED
jgi:hypothetical protein